MHNPGRCLTSQVGMMSCTSRYNVLQNTGVTGGEDLERLRTPFFIACVYPWFSSHPHCEPFENFV